MRLLLDTHAAVAFLEDDPRLGASAAAEIRRLGALVVGSPRGVREAREANRLRVGHRRHAELASDPTLASLATTQRLPWNDGGQLPARQIRPAIADRVEITRPVRLIRGTLTTTSRGDSAPPTLPQLQARVRDDIDAYNTENNHSSLGGITPAQKWATSAAPVDTIAAERLRWMLMADETGVVNKHGIHFHDVLSIAPQIIKLGGATLQVRYYGPRPAGERERGSPL